MGYYIAFWKIAVNKICGKHMFIILIYFIACIDFEMREPEVEILTNFCVLGLISTAL